MLQQVNIYDYDFYLVMFSGGKDSTACFLYLLNLGIPKRKIELWHHLVDGKNKQLMDWECTEDYCRKFALAFKVPIYYSWKDGGFESEMLRNNRPTKSNYFETPSGVLKSGGKGKPNTRLKFPQLSSDLSVRWCSAYLKIDVAAAAIRKQNRFIGKKVLIISGERAEESPARHNYAYFEPDCTDNRIGKKIKRHVDRCRLIHNWSESDVWGIIRQYGVIVHPCYYLGYGRCSCKWCIFGNNNQMATSYYLSPGQGKKLSRFEKRFGKTIKRNIDLKSFIKKGIPFHTVYQYPAIAVQAITHKYSLPIFTTKWKLPAGAFSNAAMPS